MEKQTKILIGLASIVAIAYFILNSKKEPIKAKSDNIEQDILNAEIARLKYSSTLNEPCEPANLGCREELYMMHKTKDPVDQKFYDLNYLQSILK